MAGAPSGYRLALSFRMMTRSLRRRSDLSRAVRRAGMFMGSVLLGLLELVALQRMRYQAWRHRADSAVTHG